MEQDRGHDHPCQHNGNIGGSHNLTACVNEPFTQAVLLQ